MFLRKRGNSKVDAFVLQSFEELKAKQDTIRKQFAVGDGGRWDADLELGTIRFTTEKGVFEAAVQVVGSYSYSSNTFRWAWANNSIPAAVCQTANLVKLWGIKHKQPSYFEGTVDCSESDAWHFTAVALKLDGNAAAYRGPTNDGSTLVFMTFGPLADVR